MRARKKITQKKNPTICIPANFLPPRREPRFSKRHFSNKTLIASFFFSIAQPFARLRLLEWPAPQGTRPNFRH